MQQAYGLDGQLESIQKHGDTSCGLNVKVTNERWVLVLMHRHFVLLHIVFCYIETHKKISVFTFVKKDFLLSI